MNTSITNSAGAEDDDLSATSIDQVNQSTSTTSPLPNSEMDKTQEMQKATLDVHGLKDQINVLTLEILTYKEMIKQENELWKTLFRKDVSIQNISSERDTLQAQLQLVVSENLQAKIQLEETKAREEKLLLREKQLNFDVERLNKDKQELTYKLDKRAIELAAQQRELSSATEQYEIQSTQLKEKCEELTVANRTLATKDIENKLKLKQQLDFSGTQSNYYEEELKGVNSLTQLYKEYVALCDATIEEFAAGNEHLKLLFNKILDENEVLTAELRQYQLQHHKETNQNSELIPNMQEDANASLNVDHFTDDDKINQDDYPYSNNRSMMDMNWSETYTQYCSVVKELQNIKRQDNIFKIQLLQNQIDELKKQKDDNSKLSQDRRDKGECQCERQHNQQCKCRCEFELMKIDDNNLNETKPVNFSERISNIESLEQQNEILKNITVDLFTRIEESGNKNGTCGSSASYLEIDSYGSNARSVNMISQIQNIFKISELNEEKWKCQRKFLNLKSADGGKNRFENIPQNHLRVMASPVDKATKSELKNVPRKSNRRANAVPNASLHSQIKIEQKHKMETSQSSQNSPSAGKQREIRLKSSVADRLRPKKKKPASASLQSEIKIEHKDEMAASVDKATKNEIGNFRRKSNRHANAVPNASLHSQIKIEQKDEMETSQVADCSQRESKNIFGESSQHSSSAGKKREMRLKSSVADRLRPRKKKPVSTNTESENTIINVCDSDDSDGSSPATVKSQLLSEMRTRKQARFIHDAFQNRVNKKRIPGKFKEVSNDEDVRRSSGRVKTIRRDRRSYESVPRPASGQPVRRVRSTGLGLPSPGKSAIERLCKF